MSDSVEVKKKVYELSDDLEVLAKQVIVDKAMALDPAKIKYVKVYPYINRKTAGRCMIANPMTKLFGECDYVVQMSGELWDKLDEDRQKILMWHELMHVFPVQNQKTGDWDFKIRDHDVKDFYTIIKEHGVDWFHNLKTMFSSVYDIDPAKLDGFGL